MARNPTRTFTTSLVFFLSIVLTACGTGAPSGPPSAPATVRAVPGPGYVTVTWDHDGARVSSFIVKREQVGTSGAALLAVASYEVAAGKRMYHDLHAEPGVAYAYAVIAVGADGASQPATPTGGATVQMEAGVDLMVGTNHRRYDDGTGTIFIVYYVLPSDLLTDPDVGVAVTIAGPSGWNGGNPVQFSLSPTSGSRTVGFTFVTRNTIDAVQGSYALTVTLTRDGEVDTHTAEATLADPSFRLGRATGVAIDVTAGDDVAVSWSPPAGTVTSIVSVWRGDYAQLVGPYRYVAGRSVVFEGLALEDGVHQVEIAPINVDLSGYPIKTEPFGLSYDTKPFAVGDIASAACTGPDQPVAVPDAAFAAAIRGRLDKPLSDLTCTDLALLTSLSANERGIATLEGLQYAHNLTFLSVWGNELTDLGPLSGLTGLTGLNVDRNPLGGIEDLATLVNLTYLSIGATGTDDIGVVAGMSGLEMLYAWNNAITDLAPVAGLASLQRLHSGGNPIGDPSPVFGLTGLRELNLARTGLTDIAFLAAFDSLEILGLDHNELTSLVPLEQNLGLGAGSVVDVSHNRLDLDEPAVQASIQALLGRGVALTYVPQSE